MMAGLSGHHRFLGVDEVLDLLDGGAMPDDSVVLTFDDAYADILDPLRDAAETYGARGVVFAISDWVGRRSTWNHRAAYCTEHLDWAELADLRDHGYDIGSHSREHRNLRQLGIEAVDADLEHSRKALSDTLSTPVRTFSYPYGQHDDRIRAATANHYPVAFSTERKPGTCRWGDDRWAIRRIMVTASMGTADVMQSMDAYRQAARTTGD